MGFRECNVFKLDELPDNLTTDELLNMFADAEIEDGNLLVCFNSVTRQECHKQEIKHMIQGASAYKARIMKIGEFKGSTL